jgi:hypothetical protein
VNSTNSYILYQFVLGSRVKDPPKIPPAGEVTFRPDSFILKLDSFQWIEKQEVKKEF